MVNTSLNISIVESIQTQYRLWVDLCVCWAWWASERIYRIHRNITDFFISGRKKTFRVLLRWMFVSNRLSPLPLDEQSFFLFGFQTLKNFKVEQRANSHWEKCCGKETAMSMATSNFPTKNIVSSAFWCCIDATQIPLATALLENSLPRICFVRVHSFSFQLNDHSNHINH